MFTYAKEFEHAWEVARQREVREAVQGPGQLCPDFLQQLDALVHDTASAVMLDEKGISLRLSAMRELERVLKSRREFSSIVLQPYGSIANGFATCDSDIDICIVLKRKTSAERDVLKRIGQICSTSDHVCSVQYVLDARVPLVKLVWKMDLEVIKMDLTFSTAGVKNSRLLAAYCELDRRVRPLGLFVKSWAKARRIVGALDHNLSAYALMLIMIVHLQSVNPPVLPVLQFTRVFSNLRQLFTADGTVKDARGLEACIREYRSENTSSLGELFASFARMVGFELDARSHCVCPRIGAVIRKPRGRLAKRFQLNDPFENRDLARTLDRYGSDALQLEARDAWNLVQTGRIGELLDVFQEEAANTTGEQPGEAVAAECEAMAAECEAVAAGEAVAGEAAECEAVAAGEAAVVAAGKGFEKVSSIFNEEEIALFASHGKSCIKVTFASEAFVADLQPSCAKLFSEYGDIILFKMLMNQVWIKFHTKAQEVRAVRAMSGMKIGGQRCTMAILENACEVSNGTT